MSTFVVDASVAVQWFIPEQFSDQAKSLLSDHSLIAPDLLWTEVGNVLWKLERRGALSSVEAGQILAEALGLPIVLHGSTRFLRTALQLAIDSRRTVYDCLYLALALDSKCVLMTADNRLLNALKRSPLEKHIQLVSSI